MLTKLYCVVSAVCDWVHLEVSVTAKDIGYIVFAIGVMQHFVDVVTKYSERLAVVVLSSALWHERINNAL